MKTKTTAQSVVIEPVANGVIVRSSVDSFRDGMVTPLTGMNVFNDFEDLCEFLQCQFVELESADE